MFLKQLFARAPKVERRQRKECSGDQACSHPLRRDDDYARAVASGIDTIRTQATAAVEGLDRVTACLAKRSTGG